MRILGIVPARGASKRIPGKNLAPLRGRPLIAYTLDVAQHCPRLTKSIVFTDDPEIAAVSESMGVACPIPRPAELSSDATPTWPVLQHALREMERADGERYDVVVTLQPTSPLRTVEDVEGAIDLFMRMECEAVVSVVKPAHNPYYNLVQRVPGEDAWYRPFSQAARNVANSQAAPELWALNGAVYVLGREALLETSSQFEIERYMVYEMPASRSVDIDEPLDLELAEFMLGREAATRGGRDR